MTKLRFLELFLLLLTCELAACDISKVNCRMSDRNRKCTISNLMVTAKNYTFLPVASYPLDVTRFEMVKSSVPVLTSNICTTFRKLTSFIANDQHIEIVDDYAFYNCTDLIEVILEGNVIHKFGKGVFSNTMKLQRLHIVGGLLQQIDDDLLKNLSELNQLEISGNRLKEFSVSAVQNLKKLQHLMIYSNDLSELDVEQLIAQFPALILVSLNDNNFHCDRLIEILEIFASRNVTVSDYTFDKYLKKRDYVARSVRNIICLSQAQLETEKLKNALASSLDDLKDYPLGKAIIQLKDVVTAGFTDSDAVINVLYSSFNVTTGRLKNEIGSLNETLRGTAINCSVMKNDFASFQRKFEEKLNDIAESMRRNEESMDRSLHAIWVCLAVVAVFTILITASLISYGYKKFKYFNKVVSSDRICLTQNNFD